MTLNRNIIFFRYNLINELHALLNKLCNTLQVQTLIQTHEILIYLEFLDMLLCLQQTNDSFFCLMYLLCLDQQLNFIHISTNTDELSFFMHYCLKFQVLDPAMNDPVKSKFFVPEVMERFRKFGGVSNCLT